MQEEALGSQGNNAGIQQKPDAGNYKKLENGLPMFPGAAEGVNIIQIIIEKSAQKITAAGGNVRPDVEQFYQKYIDEVMKCGGYAPYPGKGNKLAKNKAVICIFEQYQSR